MRILSFTIDEPLPGKVLPEIAADHGPEEAARRYRAIVLTTMLQLRGLDDTRLQVNSRPGDADEAIRFWLLPRLADCWESSDEGFRADGWQLTFRTPDEVPTLDLQGEILCPFLSARWIHTALIGIERGSHEILGKSPDGERYLSARPVGTEQLETRMLPELPIIRTSAHWDEAVQSPLGPTLKKAWKLEA